MSARQKTVSNVITRKLWQLAEAAGMSGEQILRSAGLGAEALLRENGRLAGDKHQRVVQLLNHLPLPEAMFRTGFDSYFEDFPTLAAVCVNCRNLREALDTYLQFRGLVGELDFLTYQDNGRQIRFDYVSEGPPQYSGKAALANFSVLVQLVRLYEHGGPAVIDCELMGAWPVAGHAAEALLGAGLRVQQAANRLTFASALFDRPFPQFNAVLHGLLRRKLVAEFAALQQHGSFSAQIAQSVRAILVGGDTALASDPILERLCEQLGMTRWTLRRRLQHEGATYKDIVLKVRAEEARRLLGQSSLPLGDISDQLGFSSQSSFSRFFKEHAGVTPMHYRLDLARGEV